MSPIGDIANEQRHGKTPTSHRGNTELPAAWRVIGHSDLGTNAMACPYPSGWGFISVNVLINHRATWSACRSREERRRVFSYDQHVSVVPTRAGGANANFLLLQRNLCGPGVTRQARPQIQKSHRKNTKPQYRRAFPTKKPPEAAPVLEFHPVMPATTTTAPGRTCTRAAAPS